MGSNIKYLDPTLVRAQSRRPLHQLQLHHPLILLHQLILFKSTNTLTFTITNTFTPTCTSTLTPTTHGGTHTLTQSQTSTISIRTEKSDTSGGLSKSHNQVYFHINKIKYPNFWIQSQPQFHILPHLPQQQHPLTPARQPVCKPTAF